jgi:hypothetical protein
MGLRLFAIVKDCDGLNISLPARQKQISNNGDGATCPHFCNQRGIKTMYEKIHIGHIIILLLALVQVADIVQFLIA